MGSNIDFLNSLGLNNNCIVSFCCEMFSSENIKSLFLKLFKFLFVYVLSILLCSPVLILVTEFIKLYIYEVYNLIMYHINKYKCLHIIDLQLYVQKRYCEIKFKLINNPEEEKKKVINYIEDLEKYDSNEEKQWPTCIICENNNSTVIMAPCGHFVGCFSCTKQFISGCKAHEDLSCIKCRRVGTIIRLFDD